MKTLLFALFAALCAALCGFSSPAAARADAGLFVSSKCNNCHSVSSQKIEKKGKKEADEEEGGVEPPDLSNVGKFHDAAYFKPFLLKETAHTPHEGDTSTKKHPVKFKGSDGDLGKMAEWLATLK